MTRWVSVAVVVDGGHLPVFPFLGLSVGAHSSSGWGRRAGGRSNLGNATRPVRWISIIPYGRSSSSKSSSTAGWAGQHNRSASWPTSTIVPPKMRTRSPTSPRDGPGPPGGAQRTDSSASSRSMASPGRHFGDLHDVDELEQLLGQLLDRGLLQVHHDGDPAERVVVARRHGQRNYVETSAGKKCRDPGQHAGPVLDDYRDGLVAQAPTARGPGACPCWTTDITAPPFRRRGAAPGGRSRHYWTARPATIGKTFSWESVRKSMTTGRSSMALALSITGPTSAACSTRKATHPMASAHFT